MQSSRAQGQQEACQIEDAVTSDWRGFSEEVDKIKWAEAVMCVFVSSR